MNPIALELSDAGIRAAAKGLEGLIHLDGKENESPGYSLPEKKVLLVGRRAEGAAFLHPREFNNRFWDQLNTESLQPSTPIARNHAEMAYFHMAWIWEKIKVHGDSLIIAVPGFYENPQLGILLSIARELSIPMEGVVALPLAAASEPCPEKLLLHLDIHLHRIELTFLEQGEQLIQRDTLSLKDRGLFYLQREWIQAISEVFVHTTRYDPLHQAATEQELHNRLPEILKILGNQDVMIVEMREGKHRYQITLARDLLLERAGIVIEEIHGMIQEMVQHHGREDQGVMLQVTDRIARLPGFGTYLAGQENISLITLAPGAGALGALGLWENAPPFEGTRNISFTGSRPWFSLQGTAGRYLRVGVPPTTQDRNPTHILCGETAYPISHDPLHLHTETAPKGPDERISHGPDTPCHCSIHLKEEKVILENHSPSGTYVDRTLVFETAPLYAGQILRLGDSPEKLRFIVCVKGHET